MRKKMEKNIGIKIFMFILVFAPHIIFALTMLLIAIVKGLFT